jgi:hypothetical protein
MLSPTPLTLTAAPGLHGRTWCKNQRSEDLLYTFECGLAAPLPSIQQPPEMRLLDH